MYGGGWGLSRSVGAAVVGCSRRGSRPLLNLENCVGRTWGVQPPQLQQQRGGKKTPNVQMVPTDPEKVEADKLARLAYAAKLKAIRVECMKENEEKQAEAVRVRKLTYALIQKEKAALRAKKDKRRAEGLAKAERLHKEEKERYLAKEREAARIQAERQSRSAEHHAMLIEELEYESQFWINTPEDVESKIGDHLWEHPGSSSHGGELSMPGEELWRFAADTGLPDAEEESIEATGYIKLQMYERMEAMRAAKDYRQSRKTKWVNDTRDIVQQTDRLVKRGGAPKGWLDRKSNRSRRMRPRAQQGGGSMRDSIVPAGDLSGDDTDLGDLDK